MLAVKIQLPSGLSLNRSFFSDILPGVGLREYLFKVLLIGDPGVGKTSFVQRYTNNVFRCAIQILSNARVHYRVSLGLQFSYMAFANMVKT